MKKTKNKKIKALLVEDEDILRQVCTKRLRSEGVTVLQLTEGKNVLKSIGKYKPDVVLLDIMLPDANGFDLLEQIRQLEDEKLKNIPVLMFTNLGQKSDIEKSERLGASGYIIKANFTTKDIVKKVYELVSKGID